MKFKDGFRLGVATASTQIEGGYSNSNWNKYCDEGHVKDGSHVIDATDHYNKVSQDTLLMSELGIRDYRFSLEWARINPQLGQFDQKELNHYRVELLMLKELGIRPLLTFYHFSHPMWFDELGGFTNKDNVIYFLEYISECLKAFGDLVDEYCTINEPNVYAVLSYLYGDWPPQRKSLKDTIEVMNNLALCHIKAYELIHQVFDKHKEVKVGFAHHGRVFKASNRFNPLHQLSTEFFKKGFQNELLLAFMKGEFHWPMKNVGKVSKGIYSDYIGINYYTTSAVGLFKEVMKTQIPVNDLGWEIYPEGLIEIAQQSYNILPLPIYITENGTCDNQDKFRSRYIYDHLKVIMESELPIERYYHWCFVDNFEWQEGVSARFGLVHNDFETQERTLKNSAHFYKHLIEDHGVEPEVFNNFVSMQEYNYD